MDLYRRENKINYNFADNIEKRYFIIPLILEKQPLHPSHVNAEGHRTILTYKVDSKLLEKTEQLFKQGYKQAQPNVPDWLRKKGLLITENQEA